MAKELFDVCLTGNLLTGHNRREVAVNLAQLVGTSIPQAEQLLAAGQCVKACVDESTAAVYHEIVEETGAEALIRACLTQSEQHAVAPQPVEDEPSFDLPAVVSAPEPSQTPPPAVSSPLVAVSPPAPPLQVHPHQAIEAEATPVLEEAAPPSPEEPDQQDVTQPFATPLPAPLARRRRWPAWVLGAVGLVAVAGATVGLLPEPVEPGQAIPQVGESLNLAQPFQQQVEQFWRAQGRPPQSLQDLQWQGAQALGSHGNLTLGAAGVLLITYGEANSLIAGQTLELEPRQGERGFEWNCFGGTLNALERPLECRRPVIQP